MANYKRKRPKTAVTHNAESRGHWLRHWPRWWDVVFHTRPSRRRASRLVADFVSGRRDPDDTIMPNGRQPHEYYW